MVLRETMEKLKPMNVEAHEGEYEASRARRKRVAIFVGVLFAFFAGMYMINVNNKNESSKPTSTATTTAGLDELNARLNNGARAARSVRSQLEEYYSEVNVLNQGFSSLPTDPSWNKTIEYTANKMARALAQGRNLKIGVFGSSVAAGHDNCNYDSFERQLERTLLPVWQAADSLIVIENAGEGGACGDSHENQIFCWENLVGDVDVLVYSWSYFEQDRWYMDHEALVRWTMVSDSAPAVNTLYTDGGGDPPGTCRQTPRNFRFGKPKGPTVEEYYAEYGFISFCLEMTLKFIPGYKGKVPNGVGDGLHNTTRYASTELGGSRTKSLGVVWRNWHPGPLGFQMASDMYAYYYTEAFLRAVEMLQSEKSEEAIQQKYGAKVPTGLTKKQLPPALFCEDKFNCTLDIPPKCTSFELPQYGKRQIELIRSTDPASPFANDPYLPFKEETVTLEHLIPKQEANIEKCQHLDHCGWVMPDNPERGTLVIKVPEVEIGKVALCMFLGRNKIDELLEQDGLKFYLNNIELDKKKLIPSFPNRKCVTLWTDEFWIKGKFSKKSQNYVGVKVSTYLRVPFKLSQVIAW